MDDPLTASLDLLRRLPPQQVAQNLSLLSDTVLPDFADDLLSSVDQPLQVKVDSGSRDYLVSHTLQHLRLACRHAKGEHPPDGDDGVFARPCGGSDDSVNWRHRARLVSCKGTLRARADTLHAPRQACDYNRDGDSYRSVCSSSPCYRMRRAALHKERAARSVHRVKRTI